MANWDNPVGSSLENPLEQLWPATRSLFNLNGMNRFKPEVQQATKVMLAAKRTRNQRDALSQYESGLHSGSSLASSATTRKLSSKIVTPHKTTIDMEVEILKKTSIKKPKKYKKNNISPISATQNSISKVMKGFKTRWTSRDSQMNTTSKKNSWTRLVIYKPKFEGKSRGTSRSSAKSVKCKSFIRPN